MIFKRTLQRYGRTPEPATPYQRAGQLWDERIGSARVQARNWRLMAFGSLALSIGLASGLIWQSARSRVTPFVVEVDKLGEVQAIAPAIQNYQPNDAQIAWFLARFITDVRSLPIDPVLVRKDWLEAYNFVTGHGAVFLDGYAGANDPFKAIGDRSVSVEVTSVVRVSASSFQVKWSEQSYQQNSLVSTENWTAILTITIKQPQTADVLRKNPLGLYVDGIAWSREFDPATP
ncbi:conjugal transfer protein TrbF [Acidocella sp.]|uniref:conjugal transfer protein TrbF n=1 Tax=Acidocella sp. TaxID=50710 RepID=UPI00344B79C0